MFALALLSFVAFTGCGSPSGPGPIDEQSFPRDWPPIPKPECDGCDTPLESETYVTIGPNKADFVGKVREGVGTWEFWARTTVCKLAVILVSPSHRYQLVDNTRQRVVKADRWSNRVEFLGQKVDRHIHLWVSPFIKDGEVMDPSYIEHELADPAFRGLHDPHPNHGSWNLDPDHPMHGSLNGNAWYNRFADGELPDCGTLQNNDEETFDNYWLRSTPRLVAPVYLKRERVWERVPVDGLSALSDRDGPTICDPSVAVATELSSKFDDPILN